MAGTDISGTGRTAPGELPTLAGLLAGHRPRTAQEAADLARIAPLATAADPYDRARPLHVTASALIVHPARREVLLRWHERQQDWLQVGGHGDPGEEFPGAVALREAEEETGLADLAFWPSAELLHVVVLPVPASDRERPTNTPTSASYSPPGPRGRPAPSGRAPGCGGCRSPRRPGRPAARPCGSRSPGWAPCWRTAPRPHR
ncbi:NUDIX domain-containing protein [Kitasatospora arboriphila]